MNNKYVYGFILLSTLVLGPRLLWAQGHDGHDQESHASHDDHEDEGLHVNKDMQHIIGLSFEEVKLRAYEENIKVYGEIAQDTDKNTHITSEYDGVIKDIYVQTGAIIDVGEPMLSIEKEDGTVETMLAPHHGTVIVIHVKKGERVDNLRSLASLADLDLLRVSFDVYEKDLRFVSVGQSVNVYSTAYPDNVFKGKVVFLSPRIDRDTQTIKIRAEVDNQNHLLRLGMFVTGDLIFTTKGKVLSVSQLALQEIGNESIVFVSEGEEFSAREIKVGREFGDFVEVLEGLHEGEHIVSKGSFALKSEMQKGAFGDGHNH